MCRALAAAPLDLVILEVGMGGRLDAVNAVDADCALITSIALDHTEFRGKVGFPVFRRSLEQLPGRIAERLRLKMDIPVFASEETGQILCSIPSIVNEEGTVNVLMLGVDKPEPGITTLKLQFLDPEQFRQKPPEAAAG